MSEGREDGDRALLEAWRRGDRAAGDKLFEQHYRSVARFFRNKANEAAQEDLIHETFLACLRGVAGFRGQASFRTFLFAIAHHVLVDHLRWMGRRMARSSAETDVDELPAVCFGPSPSAAAVLRHDQRLLLEALRGIPLIHQIALELHYWEDLTAAEIGDVLGVPLGTAKTRLRDGRVYLRQQLRRLARSTEELRSTVDDLDHWARRIRAQTAPQLRADAGPAPASSST
jgi:RNA polymerase sigma-70 factor (ECF subfamily)